jgi:hypothetical protein
MAITSTYRLQETVDIQVNGMPYRIEVFESSTHKPRFQTKVFEQKNGIWILSKGFTPKFHSHGIKLPDDRAQEISDFMDLPPPLPPRHDR